MSHDALVTPLLKGYGDDKLVRLLRRIAPTFRPAEDDLPFALRRDERFQRARQLGVIELDDATTVVIGLSRGSSS